MNIKLILTYFILIAVSACSNPDSNKDNPTQKISSEEKASGKAIILKGNEHPGVYFKNLNDGDVVKSPLIVEMGVSDMQVEPAGKIDKNKGHHHLIIDGAFVKKGLTIPKDSTHLHFGMGQTCDTLALTPGRHTLTLQFGNGAHQSYGKEWSETIGITVSK
jgi:hypothetical protein